MMTGSGNHDYHKSLQGFVERLANDQVTTSKTGGGAVPPSVYHVTGRKYDKVIIQGPQGGAGSTPSVRYFVKHDTGRIFGAKSDLAPNDRWNFGTIYEAHLWDWSAYHGVPRDLENGVSQLAGVTQVGGYGQFRHFVNTSELDDHSSAASVDSSLDDADRPAGTGENEDLVLYVKIRTDGSLEIGGAAQESLTLQPNQWVWIRDLMSGIAELEDVSEHESG
jgi:hypothetical protein